MQPINVRFRVVKGKKNSNMIIRGRFVTNPKTKRDEKDLAEVVHKAAIDAGWTLPLTQYVSVSMSYDCLMETIDLTITPLADSPPTYKWGGKVDIQNIFDTVADALESNKRHPGILVNDNRISTIFIERSPLLKKAKAAKKDPS